MFLDVADFKEENARKKTKFANHSSQSICFLFIIIFDNVHLDFNLTTQMHNQISLLLK